MAPKPKSPVTTEVEEVGIKYDDNKTRFDLLPWNALEQIAEVLTFGAQKYGDYNWYKGIAFHRLFRATLNHLQCFWRGEELDGESKLPHLAHAACCVLFMLSYMIEYAKFAEHDDRVIKEKGFR